VDVPANQTHLQRVYVLAPPTSDPANDHSTEFRFWIEDISNGERAYQDSVFNGRDQ
jgi:hypothetical protein